MRNETPDVFRGADAIRPSKRLPDDVREQIEALISQHLDEVDGLIALLDGVDGDLDLEDGADDEPDGDGEPSLAHTLDINQPRASFCRADCGGFFVDMEMEHDGREPEGGM